MASSRRGLSGALPSSSASDSTSLGLRSRDLLAIPDRRWLLPLVTSGMVLAILVLLFFVGPLPLNKSSNFFQNHNATDCRPEVEDVSKVVDGPPPPPAFAYSITGSVGDCGRVKRLLKAIYHPRNEYLLHLDLEAPPRERLELARFVRLDPTFSEVGNVHMVAAANLVTYRGSTMIATYLHCAAILLKQRSNWDWFINLSASDYPLITQDDMLHVFSYLPRDLNFIQHSSRLGWKEDGRARPIMIDPGLFSTRKQDLFFANSRRNLPTSFKLFEGSAWVVISRAFVEYVLGGWDNLPRLALMYYANYVSCPEGYFHTVICNSREFQNTTVNSDLHYIKWDDPPRQHPQVLGLGHFDEMSKSGFMFGRKFPREAEVMDKIDRELLQRPAQHFTPGGWCLGSDEGGKDPCWVRGDANVLQPGNGAKLLQEQLVKLLSNPYFRTHQCTR